MNPAVPIPDQLRDVTVTYFGEVGRDWLERLPDLVAQAARVWQLDVGAPFDPAGNIGWVAPVRRADGSAAVLKVSCPSHGSDAVGSSLWDGKALEHWAGRGAVRQLESDRANQTLLVERCVPGTTCDELDFATEREVLASVLAELHSVELPEGDDFAPLSSLVEHFRRTMWDWFDRLDAPFDRGVVAQADELFTSLLSSSDDQVFLHGDLGGGKVVLSEWMVGDRSVPGGRRPRVRWAGNCRHGCFNDPCVRRAQRSPSLLIAWTLTSAGSRAGVRVLRAIRDGAWGSRMSWDRERTWSARSRWRRCDSPR